ncbi:hypothetical protein NQ176_g9056 [Zarea fungicola]|uniref:Uncharacterized protein n=1 Tax=Zarea fungicola TaxID=93591 RepID=A0ACC1MNV6_9HYPO|nr:hypothetical protein NQ176_g9056 [Lecanicillium fungicola]
MKTFFATATAALMAMLAAPAHASDCIKGNELFDSLDGENFRTESSISTDSNIHNRYMSTNDVGVIATHFANGVANCINNEHGCPFGRSGYFSSYFDCDWTCSLQVDSNNNVVWHMSDFDNIDVLVIEKALGCFNKQPLRSVAFNLFAIQGHNSNPGLSSNWKIVCDPLESC